MRAKLPNLRTQGHTIPCFHKQNCRYRPFCIFFHPEGQIEGNWQTDSKRVAKICRYAQNGELCMRSECNFYHPAMGNIQGFHLEQLMKPPILRGTSRMTSTANVPARIPVIVLNQKKLNKDLSQCLKGLAIN